MITEKMVIGAVQDLLADRKVVSVENRGLWVRRNYKITLNDSAIVFLKAEADPSDQLCEKEVWVCDLLRRHGLPAPHTLAFDPSCTLLPVPFILQEYIGGRKLGDLLKVVGWTEQRDIYRTLGRFYRQMHTISHEHAGWIQGAGNVLPFSPHRHQYQEVMVKIGSQAVQEGLMSAEDHERLKSMWLANLDWLEDHPVSLVAAAFHWVIYLNKNSAWRVTKLNDLIDAVYWDAAWDLAYIKYPVFQEPLDATLWADFVSGYGKIPDENRLRLYRAMQWLDAAMGNYLEPPTPEHECWKRKAWETLFEVDN